MAGFEQHLRVSTGIGVVTGAVATFGFGFTPAQGILSAYLCGVSGMLPDIDSTSGKPLREMSNLTAAIIPMIMMERLKEWGGDFDTALLLAILVYMGVRFAGSWMLSKMSVHRGMFHSIPALAVAALVVFLGWKSDEMGVRILMAGSVAMGFLSHLILDEIYAVQWNGLAPELNQFADSATKFFGKSTMANIFTWSLVAGLTWLSLGRAGIVDEPTVPKPAEFREALNSLPGVERL